MEPQIFYNTREPRPEWEATLAALTPRSERLSWLRLVWLPGAPEDPIQRWGIYQMIPPMFTPRVVLSEHQRDLWLHNWRVPDPAWPLSIDPEMVSANQLRLFRETGCIGSLFWIIQGGAGGHRRDFTHTEKTILRTQGVAGEAPIAGTLPYAEPDERVWTKLREIDRMRTFGKMIDVAERAENLDKGERQALVALRHAVWKWLETQVDEAVSAAPMRAWGRFWSDMPEGDPDFDRKYEAYKHGFLNPTA